MLKRLFREFKTQKVWVSILILLVALSAAIYSSFRSTYNSAMESMDNAYAELNSADIIVSTQPVNQNISAALTNLSSIAQVLLETAQNLLSMPFTFGKPLLRPLTKLLLNSKHSSSAKQSMQLLNL